MNAENDNNLSLNIIKKCIFIRERKKLKNKTQGKNYKKLLLQIY